MRGIKRSTIELLRHLVLFAGVAKRLIARKKITRSGKMTPVALETEVRRLLIQVPFTDHRGGITSLAEHLCDGRSTAQARATSLVAVQPGEQAYSRGMAFGCVIKLREPQPLGRQRVEIRCANFRAVTANIRKA